MVEIDDSSGSYIDQNSEEDGDNRRKYNYNGDENLKKRSKISSLPDEDIWNVLFDIARLRIGTSLK